MEQIVIYGASDDLVEIEGSVEGADEYPLGSGDLSEFIIEAGTEKLLVTARFSQGGTFIFGYGIAEEDEPMPNWRIVTGTHDGSSHSMMLAIDLPDGARVIPLTRNAQGEDVS